MIALVISLIVFTGGLLIAEFVSPQIHIGQSWDKIRNAAICGVASAFLGKLAAFIIGFIFFPILLLGPLFTIAAQSLANAAILFAGGFLLEEFKFPNRQSIWWTATTLAILQVLARHAAKGLLS